MAGQMWGGEGIKAGLEAQKMMGEIAMQPIEQQIKQNQVLREQADLENQKKFNQILGGMGVAQMGVERVDQLAEAAMQSNQLDLATKLMNASAKLRTAQATAGAAGARQKTSELTNTIKEADLFARVVDGAYDTNTFQAAVRTFEGMTGRQTGLADKPYSPEMVDRLKEMSLSIKDKAELGIRTAAEIRKDHNRRSSEDFRQFRKGIELRKVQATEAREARLSKNGGKPVSSPTPSDKKAAYALIRGEFPDDKFDIDPFAMENGVYAVASDAKVIQRANPSLSSDEALRQSFNKSKDAGDWKLEKRNWGKDRQKFIGGGRTPQTARTLPSAEEIKNDPGLLGKDIYYTNGKQVGKWTGTGFQVVGATLPSPVVEETDNSDNQDNEED